MKLLVVFVFALLQGIDGAPKEVADDRLTRSAEALRAFRDKAAEPARTLLNQALCIGVAPHTVPNQPTAVAKGFVSCRPGKDGAWSGPAAFSIVGGGIFWPVAGASIDLIVIATNPSTAAFFREEETVLGANPRTSPGPLGPDQRPPNNEPVIFAYAMSAQGLTGIDIAGATLSADEATGGSLLKNPFLDALPAGKTK